MFRRSGFSLAEVLVSLLILSLLSVLMVGIIPSSIFGLRQAQHRQAALQLCQTTSAGLRSLGFDQLAVSDWSQDQIYQVDSLDYTIQYRITALPEQDPTSHKPLAKLIECRVRWSIHHRPSNYEYATLVLR
ncbi:prepilin-type N-terminal cleavage/methylation domain-containing protein [bacterium]|nr:prepilin-type N-terminal cleavage/methylation domain-containing protein [bacterium]